MTTTPAAHSAHRPRLAPDVLARLRAELVALLGEAAVPSVSDGTEGAADPEAVSERHARAILDQRGRELRDAVEAALRRLDDGTYGRCASCRELLPIERLEAVPYADVCVACAVAPRTIVG